MRVRMRRNDRVHARRLAMLPRIGVGVKRQEGFIPTGVEFGNEEALCRNVVLEVQRRYKRKLSN